MVRTFQNSSRAWGCPHSGHSHTSCPGTLFSSVILTVESHSLHSPIFILLRLCDRIPRHQRSPGHRRRIPSLFLLPTPPTRPVQVVGRMPVRSLLVAEPLIPGLFPIVRVMRSADQEHLTEPVRDQLHHSLTSPWGFLRAGRFYRSVLSHSSCACL